VEDWTVHTALASGNILMQDALGSTSGRGRLHMRAHYSRDSVAPQSNRRIGSQIMGLWCRAPELKPSVGITSDVPISTARPDANHFDAALLEPPDFVW